MMRTQLGRVAVRTKWSSCAGVAAMALAAGCSSGDSPAPATGTPTTTGTGSSTTAGASSGTTGGNGTGTTGGPATGSNPTATTSTSSTTTGATTSGPTTATSSGPTTGSTSTTGSSTTSNATTGNVTTTSGSTGTGSGTTTGTTGTATGQSDAGTGGTRDGGTADGNTGGDGGRGTSTGGGSDGGTTTTTTGSDAGCADYALSLNGTTQKVTVDMGTDLPLNKATRTIEMWAYIRTSTWMADKNTLFEYGTTGGRKVFGIDFDVVGHAGGDAEVYSDGDDFFFVTGLNTGGTAFQGWAHFGATFDGTNLHGFVNGVEKVSKAVSAAFDTATSVFTIGESPNFGAAFFDGMIDEVRFWNVARTAAEITSTMNTALTGNEAGLIGYWRFNEGSGTMARDSSVKGHNGILVAAPTWTMVTTTPPRICP